jgi:hypothetical protein
MRRLSMYALPVLLALVLTPLIGRFTGRFTLGGSPAKASYLTAASANADCAGFKNLQFTANHISRRDYDIQAGVTVQCGSEKMQYFYPVFHFTVPAGNTTGVVTVQASCSSGDTNCAAITSIDYPKSMPTNENADCYLDMSICATTTSLNSTTEIPFPTTLGTNNGALPSNCKISAGAEILGGGAAIPVTITSGANRGTSVLADRH